MNPEEGRILNNLIKKYEGDKTSITTKRGFNLMLWIALSFLIFIMLELKEDGTLNDLFLIIISSFAGAGIMLVSTIQSGEKTWRVMKPFIDIRKAKEAKNKKNT